MTRKILYIVYSLNVGGLERIVVNLANALDTNNYEPFICCIATSGEFSEAFRLKDNLFVIGNAGRINANSCRAVYNIAKNNGIDIVHSHNIAGLFHSLPTAKLLRIPLIHTNHGYVEEERHNWKLRLIELFASRFVNRYVCVSRNLKREVEKRLWWNISNMIVLYNGVAESSNCAFSKRDRAQEIVVGSVGRLDPIKNYRFLLEAFSEIVSARKDCRLELIGGGDEYDDLIALRDKLQLEDKVILHGAVPKPADYLKHFDIFALASLSEGLSMSILEAMSMNKICIVSNVGGNPEIINDGVNGFLYELNDKTAFIERMFYIIDHIDSEDLKAIRESAGSTIRERFSIDSMKNHYCRIYDSLTANDPRAG